MAEDEAEGQEQPDQSQTQDPEEAFVIEGDVANIYCDTFHLNTSLWGATLYFGELRPGAKQVLKARIKVSPQMLRAISLLTAKHSRDYVESVGPVNLPNQLLHAWGLEEEISG